MQKSDFDYIYLFGESLRKLDLGGTCAWDKAFVFSQEFVVVHCIVNTSLQIIELNFSSIFQYRFEFVRDMINTYDIVGARSEDDCAKS